MNQCWLFAFWTPTNNFLVKFELRYSVLPIYRGRVYRGIGYIAVVYWTPFFVAQERDIFHEIAVTPWTQFAGDNFAPNLLTAIAFVPGSPDTIFREISTILPVNAGWNTCCVTVSKARQSIDTSIVSQSGVWLIQCRCKSRIQIVNLGINNAFYDAKHFEIRSQIREITAGSDSSDSIDTYFIQKLLRLSSKFPEMYPDSWTYRGFTSCIFDF